MDPTVAPEESVDAAVSNPVSDDQSTPSNSSTDTLVEMESVNITVEASTPPPTSAAEKNETTTDPKPDHVEKIAAAAMTAYGGDCRCPCSPLLQPGKSVGHKASRCPFPVIDAINEKTSITNTLVRALEAVPPSLSSSDSDNDADADEQSCQQHLYDAESLQRYLENSSHHTSPESSASTVKSSVPQNTPYLFTQTSVPDINFSTGSPSVIMPMHSHQ